MPKFNPVLTNFTAGEVSPRVEPRTDIARYANSVGRLENMVILPQGGAAKRSGTRFVLETKNSAKVSRLIEFEFSSIQAYALEFGDQYIRFFKNGGVILSAGVPYEIVTPYLEADLPRVRYIQSADVIFLTHPNYAPRTLSRFSDTNWVLATMVFIDGPYKNGVFSNVSTMTPAATSGSNITVTASTATFLATDVGKSIRIRQGSTWGYATIITFTDTTHVKVNITANFGSTLASDEWRMSAWGSVEGWPSTVTFQEQRLAFADNPEQPQTNWLSQSGNYTNYGPSNLDATVTDSNAITYTIASNKVNAIRNLVPGPTLVVCTVGGEWQAKPGTINQALTPTNIQITPQTTFGCADIRAIRIASAVIFVQRSLRKLREIVYDFQIDAFSGRDLSLLSEHLCREGGGLKDLAYQQEPNSIVWCIRNDGILLGLSYLRDQEIIGWHRHQIGGAFTTGNAVVESTAVIPSQDGSADQLWMIVKRTINGVQRRYVEYMELEYNPLSSSDKLGMVYVDCAATYTGAPATVIRGLGYLEGQTVSILADGAVQPQRTVVGGSITLASPASLVTVGLPFTAKIKTLPFEGGTQFGSSQGKIKRPHGVTISLLSSLGMKVGPSEDKVRDYVFRKTSDLMDQSPPLFTGYAYQALDNTYDALGEIWITHDQPYSFVVRSIMPEQVVYEKA